MALDLVDLASQVLDAPRAVGVGATQGFVGAWQGRPAHMRWYASEPGQASVELAVRRRVAGLVPLAAVLVAHLRPGGPLAPHLVTEQVAGKPADVLLDGGLAPASASALGRQCARVVLCLRGVRAEGHGRWLDADLRVGRWSAARQDLERWYDAHEAGLAAAGLGRRSAPWLRPYVRSAGARLSVADRPAASVVHGSLHPANLLVDASSGALRAVQGWDRSHGGDWALCAGRLLRSADVGAGGGGRGASSWTAFRRALVDGLHTGLSESGTSTAVGAQGWEGRAQDLDVFSLLEQAARPVEDSSPEVWQARQWLRTRGRAR